MSRRVLLVVDQLRRPVPGGIGRYAVGLLEGLVALDGAQGIGLFAGRAPRANRQSRAVGDPLEAFGVPVRASKLASPLLVAAWDRGLGSLPAGFDVVHAVSLVTPPRPGPGRGDRRALTVVVHDLAWREHPEATTRRGRRWHEAALGRALGRAGAIFVPSSPVADQLAAGASSGSLPPVTVVPWGADHLPSPDHAAAAAVLSAHGVDGPFLLTASTIEPRKNLPRLVDAYHRAVPSLPEPWPLVVAGPSGWGGVRPRGGEAADGRVVAVGKVGDAALAALYAEARVFVYVPLVEGYGFPPIEAMRAGTPVVASTGVPSVDVDAPAALRVDPLDTDAIAAALVASSTDETLRARLRAEGRDLAGGRSWRQVAARHREVWEAVG